MSSLLCLSIRFLQPYSHGRGEDGEPEWPPSPLRLTQSLVAASAGLWNERSSLVRLLPAMHWLETLPPPRIMAARAVKSQQPYRLYVPDNIAEKVAASWAKGRDASIADYRAEKDVCCAHLDGDSAYYLYTLPASGEGVGGCIELLAAAARSITHLGWGIDMAVGDAAIITEEQAALLPGQRWLPSPSGGTPLRVPRPGTLDDLVRKHADFLGRLSEEGFRPVPPLREFDVVQYRRGDEPLARPCRVFELRLPDGSRFRYPQSRLMHIAGMVRHLAIAAMRIAPPRGVDDDWVETYIAGHRRQAPSGTAGQVHRQLSYLPLPSIGNVHTDPAIRRVMIAAPVGDEAWLDHVARRIAGQLLIPERGDEFPNWEAPILVPVRHDAVSHCYTHPANTWTTVTPVILPGHDDHKPAKTSKLIEKALAQSGIAQPCTFEWGPYSRFAKSHSAHKYDHDGRPVGYLRPDHLLQQTAVHLQLTFADDLRYPGPLVIGAGRHCGFGLMASVVS